jgi:hypothetical protein
MLNKCISDHKRVTCYAPAPQVSYDEASNMVTTVEGQLEEMRAFLEDYQPITAAPGPLSPQASPAKPISRLPSGVPTPQQQQQGAAGSDNSKATAGGGGVEQQGASGSALKAEGDPATATGDGKQQQPQEPNDCSGASGSAQDGQGSTGLGPEEEEEEATAIAAAIVRGQQKKYVGTRWIEGMNKWRAVTTEVTDGQRKER